MFIYHTCFHLARKIVDWWREATEAKEPYDLRDLPRHRGLPYLTFVIRVGKVHTDGFRRPPQRRHLPQVHMGAGSLSSAIGRAFDLLP